MTYEIALGRHRHGAWREAFIIGRTDPVHKRQTSTRCSSQGQCEISVQLFRRTSLYSDEAMPITSYASSRQNTRDAGWLWRQFMTTVI